MRLGIVFSKTNCRAILLKKNHHQLACLKAFFIEKNEERAWQQSTLSYFRKNCGKLNKVILGVENQSVMMRELTIDATLSDKQILNYLRMQSDHLFGYAAEKLSVDYEIIKNKIQGKKLIRVVSALQVDMTYYQELFLSQNFQLSAIDIDSLALERFYQFENNIINKTMISNQDLKKFAVAIGLALWGLNEY
ncbi:MAG: hypothetical protein A3E82_02870 [Gammaproteobacteria bacterium RIFCSPHIGHO2_12_FULL_38_11]|nr:MAG: hypothetical protein A3E82_02870 [Gammaproteobacteria bacterium RIFCSPHIGHO2_12_FULL_38_11]